MEPLVSVIIATYNRADLVAKAVESALNQTYKNIEIVVVDDGSTDNTRQALRQYEGRIEYIYQERSERSKARNVGFRHSSGDFIAFLDSDDLWLPTKIEKQVQVLNEKPDVGVIYADAQFIDRSGDTYDGEICLDVLKRMRQDFYEDLMTDNIVGSPSAVLVRRECLVKAGLFDESMNACEDLDLWIRLARHCRFHKIELPLLQFRIHTGNTQCKLSLMAKGYETIINKVCRDTPPQFKYYKNEAIIKLLSKIASLYAQDRNLRSFMLFCVRSVFQELHWIIGVSFWLDFFRLSKEKYRKRLRNI